MAPAPPRKKQSSPEHRGHRDRERTVTAASRRRSWLTANPSASFEKPRTILAAALALIAVTFCVWAPALHFGFIYDDHLQIESNPWIQSWSHLGPLLRQPLWSQLGPEHASPYYRPLFSLLLLVQYSLFGADPALWHLVSIALESIVTLALFAFLLIHLRRRLPAFLAALLFATSPLAAEVVVWASASDELLCTLFILLGLCALVLAARTEEGRRAILLRWISVGLLVLAVLAKETGVVGVLFALAYDLLFIPPRASRSALARGWIFSIPIGVFLLTHHALHTPGASPHPLSEIVATMLSAAALGLRKLLWPLPVSEFYDLWFAQPRSEAFLLLCGGVLAGILVAVVWTAFRSRFGGWSLVVVLLPLAAAVAGIELFRDYDLFHDRYLYLPLAGVAILLAMAVARLEVRPRIHTPVVAVLVLVAGVQGWAARSVSRQFSSDLALASHAVQVAPHNIAAWQLLADTQLKMRDCRTALDSQQRAEQLRPDLWQTAFFLGVTQFRCGSGAEAEESFSLAAAIPAATTEQAALGWYELGRVRIARGNIRAAQEALRQAARSDPSSRRIRKLLEHISSPQRSP